MSNTVRKDYGHKRARNKRLGPGGGTRRLHQYSFIWRLWGRNRIDGRLKELALARWDTTVIGSIKASCKWQQSSGSPSCVSSSENRKLKSYRFAAIGGVRRHLATEACPFTTVTPKMDISLFIRVINVIFIEKIYPNLGSIYDLWNSNFHPLVFFGWEQGGQVGFTSHNNHLKVVKIPINKGFNEVTSEKTRVTSEACHL